jgi:hypothetical protein
MRCPGGLFQLDKEREPAGGPFCQDTPAVALARCRAAAIPAGGADFGGGGPPGSSV